MLWKTLESWENDSGGALFFLDLYHLKTLWPPRLHNCWEISCVASVYELCVQHLFTKIQGVSYGFTWKVNKKILPASGYFSHTCWINASCKGLKHMSLMMLSLIDIWFANLPLFDMSYQDLSYLKIRHSVSKYHWDQISCVPLRHEN